MPLARMIDKLAPLLTKAAVNDIVDNQSELLDALRSPHTLVAIAANHGDLDVNEAAYFAAIPGTLLEAMRAGIVEAIDNLKAVHLQFSPGYEFGIKVTDYGEAVSIHVTGPYSGVSPGG